MTIYIAINLAFLLIAYLFYLKIIQIEKKIARLSNQLNTPEIPESTKLKIEVSLKQGDRSQAIHLYREETGLGLKEADDYIRQIEQKPLAADVS